jgi:hypothetical protein
MADEEISDISMSKNIINNKGWIKQNSRTKLDLVAISFNRK